MSAPQPPETAVEAIRDSIYETADLLVSHADARIALAAALPHLHRAWLEGLIAKLDAEEGGDGE